jgi:hypothetical protein
VYYLLYLHLHVFAGMLDAHGGQFVLQVSCVYHSEAAENQFLQNPRKSVLGDGYQARTPQALSAPGLDAPQ